MAVTHITIHTGLARKKPTAGDTKTIGGVLHVRKQSRVGFGPHRGALIVSNGRPVYEWVPTADDRPLAQGAGDLMTSAEKVAPVRITRSPARCAGCSALLGEAHVRGCRFAELA